MIVDIYSAAMSTLNFFFLLIITVMVTAIFRRYRKQCGSSTDPERAHRKENGNGVAVSVQNDTSGPGFDTFSPLLTRSREPLDDVAISIPSPAAEIQSNLEHFLVNLSNTQAKVPQQRRSDEANAVSTGAQRPKERRTPSLPRSPDTKHKAIRQAKPTSQAQSMKMVTTELNSSKKFQRRSKESQEPRPNDSEREPEEACRGAAVVNSNRGTKANRGNEYQLTVLVKDPARDTSNHQDHSPYYHKVMQDATWQQGDRDPEDEIEDPNEGGGFREERSMSETWNTKTTAYGFPLKMTTEKNAEATKKTRQPVDDYEQVAHNPFLEKTHSVVVAAEDGGEYSKLNRREKITENTARVPTEGYDHLSNSEKETATPVLYGLEQLDTLKEPN
ncbi:uncharacterized protein LOC110987782 isoform X2 [Acanthaster planci]|uniref:Uncharacterized protein LOC110987782 isoform X2 n=1 Tax=Acanthaster planci TaxID=133434 RepID=A0A8B7ZM76_ACAPL|nr:uncharacterized protein LOC110987782 isoform X2 [Acanthaster planci]